MKKILTMGGGIAVMLILSLLGIQSVQAAITSQLDLGSTGSDVRELQTYLATNVSIYPSGLVTGYFGQLTKAGVERFQTAQGIVSAGTPATTGYGRVGPTTMARINALLGGVINPPTTYWDAAPTISNVFVQYDNNSATITWATNEITQGEVYFDNVPLRADEATGPNQKPYVSGTLITETGGLRITHSVVLQNLLPNTNYYYLVRGIDNVGNLSTTLPNSFRTNQ